MVDVPPNLLSQHCDDFLSKNLSAFFSNYLAQRKVSMTLTIFVKSMKKTSPTKKIPSSLMKSKILMEASPGTCNQVNLIKPRGFAAINMLTK